MAKYKNTSGLTQLVVLAGKKVIIENNAVFENNESFSQIGIDPVPDDTPITVTTGSMRRRRLVDQIAFQEIEEKINSSVSEKAEMVSKTSEQLDKLAAISREESNSVKQEFAELKKLVLTLTTQMKNVQNDVNEHKALVLRRLEILKNNAQAMEAELQELYGEGETPVGK